MAGPLVRRVWRGAAAVVLAMTWGMASPAASPRSGVEPSWRGTGGQGAGSREGGIKRLLGLCPNHGPPGSWPVRSQFDVKRPSHRFEEVRRLSGHQDGTPTIRPSDLASPVGLFHARSVHTCAFELSL